MAFHTRRTDGGKTSLLFIYAVIVAAIFVLIIRIFVSEKDSLWDAITKRYKATKGDRWKEELKRDTKQMENDFSSAVSQDFKHSEY